MWARVAGRIALLIACLSVALPTAAWAGSAQASLAVGVVVPARCAVRVAGALPAAEGPGVIAATGHETVAMQCTKGTLPSSGPVTAATHAVGPRITRDMVLTSASLPVPAPRPLTEQGPSTSPADAAVPRLIITVNF